MPKSETFTPLSFLSMIGGGKKVQTFARKRTIFSQGSKADSVFYIQSGKVKITVFSKQGKEAVIAILGAEDFFGEGAITGQKTRLFSASTLTDCVVMRISMAAILKVLHEEHTFSDFFVKYLITRNARYEADLVDQLFNSSEKRLARILLLLARYGKTGDLEQVVPHVSQETLAEMVGTTRSRVSFFMNRFRKLGFIEYNGKLKIHNSLLNVVLHEYKTEESTSRPG